jgi:hypothetical protein
MNEKEINKDLLASLTNSDKNEEGSDKEIIFRNYLPHDKNLKIEKCYKLNEVKSVEDKIKANVLKTNTNISKATIKIKIVAKSAKGLISLTIIVVIPTVTNIKPLI